MVQAQSVEGVFQVFLIRARNFVTESIGVGGHLVLFVNHPDLVYTELYSSGVEVTLIRVAISKDNLFNYGMLP